MAGPIATEVVEEMRSGPPVPVAPRFEQPVPVRPTEVVQTSPAPNSPPTLVTNTNTPKPYTAAWWFEKGGTTGIVCFLVVALFGWLMNAQREGQNAIITTMQAAEKNRSGEAMRVIDGVIKTQDNLGVELRAMTKAIEKLDARIERILPGKE